MSPRRWKRCPLPADDGGDKTPVWSWEEYAIAECVFLGREGWGFEVYHGPRAARFLTGRLIGTAPTLTKAKALAEADMKQESDER